jgi:hypothetical protein
MLTMYNESADLIGPSISRCPTSKRRESTAKKNNAETPLQHLTERSDVFIMITETGLLQNEKVD